VGGFVGPYLIGKVREQTGSFTIGLLLLAGSLMGGVLIVAGLGRAGSGRRGRPESYPGNATPSAL
jgi:hypothetical protein